jgi:hypothetical protein
MAKINEVYQFEGDDTQRFGTSWWRSRVHRHPKRVRYLFARIEFVEGDLSDYQALLDTRNDTIQRNKAKLAEMQIDESDGSIAGGWGFGFYALAEDALEAVPAEPTYAGDQFIIFNVYVDGVLKLSRQLYESTFMRLDGVGRGIDWEVEMFHNVEKVRRIEMSTSMREMKNENLEQQQQQGV